MPLQVLQRPDWHGTPHELGDLFIVRKDRPEARAQLVTHQLGWEVRLLIGAQLEFVQTQVCRTQEEVLATGEQWALSVVEVDAVRLVASSSGMIADPTTRPR